MVPSRAAMTERLAPWLILLVGSVAFSNSLAGPFLFDDYRFLSDESPLDEVWPPARLLGGTTRPLVRLSLAANYALGGLDVRGYHVVNLVIHLLAALLLFGIIRRTLLSARLRARYGSSASSIALVASLLWVAHPLQTESVTYLSQRAESLMGLWYLLTLYGPIRGAQAARPARWHLAAIGACALGMLTKPVMVTAPLLVALYDRIFLAASWRAAWQRRRRLYLGLAATWGLLVALLSGPHESTTTAGMIAAGVSPWDYARSQFGVIAHYLRLAVWPDALCLDYDWPVATTPGAIVWPGLVIGGFLLATGWALRRRPVVGFLGVWWFLILAPTSSVIPLRDLAAEHRMYLPLAALALLAAVAARQAIVRLVPSAAWRRRLILGLAVLAVVGLSARTLRRNADYRDEIVMWRSVVIQRPEHPRARNNLGRSLARVGALDDAIRQFDEALRLAPDYGDARYNLGLAFQRQGRLVEALVQYTEALRLRPQDAEAHNNLGVALAQLGRRDEAIVHYTEALRLKPDYAVARANLDGVGGR